MSRPSSVSLEIHHEIEQFLFLEAHLLDTEQAREWLTTLVDPEIRYQVGMRQLRYRKDTRNTTPSVVYASDDNWALLDIRIKVIETGLQWVSDPPGRLRHLVSNVLAFNGACDGEYVVRSNCIVVRNRAVYEEMIYVYGRDDVLRRDATRALRLLKRVIDYDQRFVRGKNLLFIL